MRDRNSRTGSLLIAALAAGLVGASPLAEAARAVNTVYRFPRPRSSRVYKPNGKRECARRMRQIAKGMLREENGLVREVQQASKAA